MTLTVEDGSNVAGAESYATVTFVDGYHSDRGNSAWALLSTPQKEQSLRKATEFMLERYRPQWKGFRKFATQALDFPRTFVYLEPFIVGAVGEPFPYLLDNTIVPLEVKKACAELALRASTATLMPDTKTRQKRKTVGPITIEYDIYSPQNPVYRSVDALLSPYLKNGYGSVSNEVQRA